MDYTGKKFADIASIIDRVVGNLKSEEPKPQLEECDRREMLRNTYKATSEIVQDCLADKYFHKRGIGELVYPASLRFAEKLRDGEGGIRPAIVAMIGVHGEDKPVSMHRTFLAPSGMSKAEMKAPRKIMPGGLPDGSCVMLSDYHGGPIGIAEGIETAMSASALYGIPVWAALNATMLSRWTPPKDADEVVVFGDNDAKFGGQMAAYRCAHRAAVKGYKTYVNIPSNVGEDWNDILLQKADQ